MQKLLITVCLSLLTFSCSLVTSFDDNTKDGEICDNGIDDDGDSHVDCDDQDCRNDPHCAAGTEICDNQIDDDGDALVDCDDPDCAVWPDCDQPGEDCGNGSDDDGDGFVDCQDQECFNDPMCMTIEMDCSNGLDDDGDGQIDCQDPDCAMSDFCQQTDNCQPQFAWWNADDSPAGCPMDTSCTYVTGGVFDTVGTGCEPVLDDIAEIECEGDGFCPKGSACINHLCVFVCSPMDHPQCPGVDGNLGKCKGAGIHPLFEGFSYCVSMQECNPLESELTGCPEFWQCKVDFDAPSATIADLPTYCLPDLGGLSRGMSCTVSDECKDSLVCSPTNFTCTEVCTKATDCLGGGTGLTCQKIPTSTGESTYGYCKPIN
ncbi:hypothetical protein KKF84_21625 [Myxococcota bacterium]|nr:hypothetical protein [Myxococcota bacterium]MBU1537927.1 hypothetical protein [Myxococcota bacterium]